MPLHAATIFVGSFLLFFVQPIVAKQILPWFGGASSVWTTCMVFFQVALLAGYAYAHAVTRHTSPRTRALIHVAVLAVSVLWLPILADESWKPRGDENPSWRIVGFLAATIGLPFLALSANGPLLQAWFARARPGQSPYRLFALSNLASFLALLGYPFLVEPWLTTGAQAWIWSGGYAVYIVLCAVVALLDRRLPEAAPSAAAAADDAPDAPAPTLRDYALWTTLAALGSILLLGVSNHLTQDVASIPLLWVVPLSIYLATFIICFEREGWYRPVPFAIAAAAAVVAMAAGLSFGALRHVLWLQLAVFCGGLFVACMACHGELARLKPTGRHLTGFYLTIALGGAIGAALVGIGAPLALPDHFEIEIGIAALSLLLFLRMRTSTPLVRASLLVALVATCFATVMHIQNLRTTAIVLTRNFYGVLRVMDGESEGARQRWIVHGAIIHGRQWLDPARRREPAGYFRKESGGGRALVSLEGGGPRRVGIIGLGAGALAAYGRAGDTYRLYEINPAVITMARRDFTYLADSAATIETVLGDARLQLEREAPQRYDILIIDAFSGDSIPMHLVTREALRLYRRHVVDGGIVAFHISNKFLDLAPALREIALDAKLAVGMVRDRDAAGMPVSDWVLMAPDRSAFEKAPLAGAVTEIRARPELGVWTDDFNTIVRILR